MILCIDIETCSAADIDDGAAPYAEHPTTRVYVVCAALADQRGVHQSTRWFPGDAVPRWVAEHIVRGRPVLAHNASFEASIFRAHLCPAHGWPSVHDDQWRDTLAHAAALCLPLSLAKLGPVVGANVLKDDEGHKLMTSKAKVRTRKGALVYPTMTPTELERLADYCMRDVLSTIAVWFRLPALPPEERTMILVDRRINSRGALLDQPRAAAMADLALQRKAEIGSDVWETTEDIWSTSKLQALGEWLTDRGVVLPKVRRKRDDGTFAWTPSLSKESVLAILKRPALPDDVRKVLELRAESGRLTSLAKTARVPFAVCSDGRLRYALRYSKATTGRWSSEILQVHNLARPSKQFTQLRDAFAAAVMQRDLAGASMLHPLLEGLSFLLRTLVIAGPGKVLVGGDFAGIEARVNAWLAGDEGKLAVFRAYDAATTPAERAASDPYVHAAKSIAAAANLTCVIDRQIGKVAELGLGYQMGAVRFRDHAANNGVLLLPADAAKVVRAWRKTNAKIVAFWKDLEDACVWAIEHPGDLSWVGDRLMVTASNECLQIVLPSGRTLRYWRPHRRPVTKQVEIVNKAGEIETIEIEGVELRFFVPGKTGMELESTYGGKLVENVVQAVARDLLRDALIRLDATPFDVVLHVHDSIAAEVPEALADEQLFGSIMAKAPRWAAGLPLAVETYKARHFKG